MADERARIARELHDIVAHGVSSMVVQAGAAAQALATSRSAGRRAFRRSIRPPAQALAELRRVGALIRDLAIATAVSSRSRASRSRRADCRDGHPDDLQVEGDEGPVAARPRPGGASASCRRR